MHPNYYLDYTFYHLNKFSLIRELYINIKQFVRNISKYDFYQLMIYYETDRI